MSLAVIKQKIKEYKQIRDKKNNFKFILKVTTCSSCGASFKSCKCPYGNTEIEALANLLNNSQLFEYPI